MISAFLGPAQPKTDLWGLLLIVVLVIIGIIITTFWLKGPKATKKITRYIPLSLVLILVGVLFSGGGVYPTFKQFSTALNITTDNYPEIVDKSWAQTSYSSDALRWAALIGSSFLVFFAGFTIDLKLFKKYGLTAILVSFLPIFFEGTFFAILITPVLYIQEVNNGVITSWGEFNWVIAFFIGYAIAAASPGIALPLILKFQKMGYGKYNKISDIAVICGSIDSITSLGLILVFFSLVLGVQTGSLSNNISSTFVILFARIPAMILVSAIVAFASYLLFMFWVKAPLDKFVPHVVEIKGKKIKIWNILALFGLIFIIILVNEMCQYADNSSLSNIFATKGTGYNEVNNHILSWIFPYSFLVFLIMGILLSNRLHKDVLKKGQEEKVESFIKSVPALWLWIFAPLVFGSIGGLIIFKWIFEWGTLLYIVIILFSVIVGRSIGGRLSLYDHEKFKWNDVEVFPLINFPKGTTPAASMVFFAMLISFAEGAQPDGAPSLDLYATMLLPLFKICIAAIIISVPTNEFVFDYYFKHFMPLTEEGVKPDPIPIPIFSKINAHYKGKDFKTKK